MYSNISESAALLTIDIPITWYSQTAQTDCKCRLRIYKISFDKAIVIVSELDDNPGRSITDEAFTLIHMVGNDFKLTFGKTMWLEHYPADYLKDEDTYDEVIMVQGQVYSKRINKQKIEALLRVKL